ncbi:MAG: hypothetical protein AAFO82_20050, partial [Bacteroidota bacterium]
MLLPLFFTSFYSYTQDRGCDPVIMLGQDVPCLIGEDPAKIVAFKVNAALDWEQVPIQIDERLVLDIAAPYGNATCLSG